MHANIYRLALRPDRCALVEESRGHGDPVFESLTPLVGLCGLIEKHTERAYRYSTSLVLVREDTNQNTNRRFPF